MNQKDTMIILDLDYPPSANTYWRHARGRHYIGEKGLAFRASVISIVATHKQKAPDGRLELGVMLYPPDRRRRDIDNVCKALLDSMTYSGLIEDDSLIDKLTIERGAMVKGGKCRIYLSEYKQQDDIT
jgi:crossover junction endodeoxyribonuclease RusA